MTPLTWDIFIMLVLQHGLPLALKLADKWQNKDVVQPAELAELRIIGAQTAQSQMLEALARAGIPTTDPRAAALLALLNPPAPVPVAPPSP